MSSTKADLLSKFSSELRSCATPNAHRIAFWRCGDRGVVVRTRAIVLSDSIERVSEQQVRDRLRGIGFRRLRRRHDLKLFDGAIGLRQRDERAVLVKRVGQFVRTAPVAA